MYCTIGDIRIPVNFAALLVVGQILVVVLVVNVPDYSPTVLVARWQFREGHCCVPLATLERDVGLVRRGFGMPEGAIPPDRAGLVAPTRDGYLQCYYIHGVSIKIIIIVHLRVYIQRLPFHHCLQARLDGWNGHDKLLFGSLGTASAMWIRWSSHVQIV